jgi:hypothetical protein
LTLNTININSFLLYIYHSKYVSGEENGAERAEKRVSGSETENGACEKREKREQSAERGFVSGSIV